MALIVGAVLAFAVGAFATLLRLDRERSFYATVAIVVATYYVLFAAMGAPAEVLVVEILIASVFALAASVGFLRSPWIVVAALAGHGIQDLFHDSIVHNAGVPAWWPHFCMAYDAAASIYLACLIRVRRASAAA